MTQIIIMAALLAGPHYDAQEGGGGGSGSGFPITDDTQACWGTGDDACYEYDTAQTNDALCLGLSTDSETLHITQEADCSTDWTLADQGTPTVVIHDADQTDVTKYLLLQHDGTDGVLDVGTGQLRVKDSIDADSHVEIGGQAYQTTLTTSTPAGTTQTIDWDSGNIQKIDLEDATGDVTLTLTNPQVGRYILIVQQDGAGGARDLVWPAAVNWANASTPVVSTGNDAIDLVECIWDGSADYYCAAQQDFQ